MELYDFYTKVLKLQNEEVLKRLLIVSKHEYLKKGSVVFHEGDDVTYTTFLVKGILRGYFWDNKGNEITDCFCTKCGSPTAVYHNSHTVPPISLETLTESEIISIPVLEIEELQKQYIEVSLLYNKLLLSAFEEHWEVKTTLYRYSAMERYKWFMNKYPELIGEVSNKYIASYLNITAITLSRLKRELNKSKTDTLEQ